MPPNPLRRAGAPLPAARFASLYLAAWLAFHGPAFAALPPPETVFFNLPADLAPDPIPAPSAQLAALPGYPNDPAFLTLVGRFHLPDPDLHGAGPYPAVVVLHGSGGMWSNDLIANGPLLSFVQWAGTLNGLGYAVLFVDSFNPRGIAGDFEGKRPHHDPAMDDSLCSPNYERPKDVVAALAFLASRSQVDGTRIGLLGFSHGAQAGLNAILDPAVDRSPYVVDYVNEDDETEDLAVPAPVRIPASLPFPRVGVFYYPGCGHHGYHGPPGSIAAGRYLPDRRTRVLMFHGTADSLMGVDDQNASPLTGDLYPIRFVESAALQAAALGVPNPIVHHFLFAHAAHSFDLKTIEPPANWNTPAEDVNEKAKRLARDETLKWLEFRLKPAALAIRPQGGDPAGHEVAWIARPNLRYRLESSDDLVGWNPAGPTMTGTGLEETRPVNPPPGGRIFLRLDYGPLPPPVADPANAGFFLDYAAFSP